MSQDYETNDPIPPEPTPPSGARKAEPRLKIPVPPDLPHDDPEHGSPHRRLSTMVGVNFLLLLVLMVLLGLMYYRQSNAPTTPAANSEDSKAMVAEVDKLKSEIAGLAKKLDERPAPGDASAQIKMLDDKVADLYKSLAETPARIEALNQKVEAATKNESFAPAHKVEAIDKKVGELTQVIDSLKASLAARPAPAGPESEVPAMTQAVDLFKKGKFLEAKEAFTRLQTVIPDDPRVWYFSALANGLATRDWKGESERLVNTGLAKEKAGLIDKAKIDAAFADLTTTTGKDWLAYYRNKATQ